VDRVLRLFYLTADHQIVINVTKVVFFQSSVLFGRCLVGLSLSGFQRSPDIAEGTHPRIPGTHLRDGNVSVSWALSAGGQFFGHSGPLYYPSCATATEGLFVGVNGLAREGLIGSPGVPVFGYEIIV
jgi:hypothetical protein